MLCDTWHQNTFFLIDPLSCLQIVSFLFKIIFITKSLDSNYNVEITFHQVYIEKFMFSQRSGGQSTVGRHVVFHLFEGEMKISSTSRGAWVAQLVKCLPSAQVMILGVLGLSPTAGSLLGKVSACPSPSAPPPTPALVLSFCLR